MLVQDSQRERRPGAAEERCDAANDRAPRQSQEESASVAAALAGDAERPSDLYTLVSREIQISRMTRDVLISFVRLTANWRSLPQPADCSAISVWLV